jgi:hypothetical protein
MDIKKLQCFQHIKWNPSKRDLRQFGFTALAGLAIIGTVVLLRAGHVTTAVLALWLTGAVLCILSLMPVAGRAAYFLVNVPAGILGFCISRIGLTLIFFMVFLPIGYALRLMGRDSLQMRRDSRGWLPVSIDRSASSFYRQF